MKLFHLSQISFFNPPKPDLLNLKFVFFGLSLHSFTSRRKKSIVEREISTEKIWESRRKAKSSPSMTSSRSLPSHVISGCPHCSSPISPYHLNLEEILFMCSKVNQITCVHSQCLFPMEEEDMETYIFPTSFLRQYHELKKANEQTSGIENHFMPN